MADQDLSTNPVRELVRRFLITLLIGVVVYRFGTFIPIPDVNVEALRSLLGIGKSDGSAVNMILRYADMFNGGAIANASIFGLGIMPYISASIIMQLLTFSFPALKTLQKEGESGRKKINQYTRYFTVVICVIQAAMAASALAAAPTDGPRLVTANSTVWFVVQSVLVITTGSMVLLWLAEQITKFGIGNGVSVIIMIGILASIPSAMAGNDEQNLQHFLLIAAVSLSIIAGIVVVVQATRRIPLEQARRVQGNKVYGGAQTTLPLKLNQANVIPVIFASPVMVLLGLIAASPYVHLNGLFDNGTAGYRYCFAGLIVAFTYFYISITFDLNDLSNHFKTQGFFVRGIKPGKKTVDYLTWHLHRITFVGAIFLAVIAILPDILDRLLGMGSGRGDRMLMGGTGLLIVVGVALDVMQKVASFFLANRFGAVEGLGASAGGRKAGSKRF